MRIPVILISSSNDVRTRFLKQLPKTAYARSRLTDPAGAALIVFDNYFRGVCGFRQLGDYQRAGDACFLAALNPPAAILPDGTWTQFGVAGNSIRGGG